LHVLAFDFGEHGTLLIQETRTVPEDGLPSKCHVLVLMHGFHHDVIR
jgi:hypothetical protein